MPEHEQEAMDRLLRSALSGQAPSLSSDFDIRLAKRLHSQRLDLRARLIMVLYALVAAALTIWAMRDLGWSGDLLRPALLIPALLIAVPLSFAWTLRRLERPPNSAAQPPR